MRKIEVLGIQSMIAAFCFWGVGYFLFLDYPILGVGSFFIGFYLMFLAVMCLLQYYKDQKPKEIVHSSGEGEKI